MRPLLAAGVPHDGLERHRLAIEEKVGPGEDRRVVLQRADRWYLKVRIELPLAQMRRAGREADLAERAVRERRLVGGPCVVERPPRND